MVRRIARGLVVVALAPALVTMFAAQAAALEVNGGVGVGAIQVGSDPALAVSPFAGVLWRTESGFLVELHNMLSVLPGSRVGLHDRTSATIGYRWKTGNFSVGPSLSVYSMAACVAAVCRRVDGLAPGGHAQADWYFIEPLGVSVSGNFAWYGGTSVVLADNAAVMVTAGPILRWETKQ